MLILNGRLMEAGAATAPVCQSFVPAELLRDRFGGTDLSSRAQRDRRAQRDHNGLPVRIGFRRDALHVPTGTCRETMNPAGIPGESAGRVREAPDRQTPHLTLFWGGVCEG
jgi:hypothetical protein